MKVFWSVIAERLISYLLANENIDTNSQEEHSGCMEHTTMISQVIKEDMNNNIHSHMVIFYQSLPDPANPKGPGALPSIIRVCQAQYVNIDSLKLRFTVGIFTTKWQRLGNGIMAGGTISTVHIL